MWILSSDGDLLEGKRVWLKPGKKYLFGRVARQDVRHAINHPTISRRHLVIEVRRVEPGDGTHIHTRSHITLSDQNTTCGTVVDGESIKGKTKELTDQEHTVYLGKYQFPLRIKWCPAVLSFSLPSKELKSKDPLAHARSRLEDLDIKTVIPYLSGKTTHVVQSKRNTAKGLQALIEGRYIVEKSYVEAIVYAATPNDLTSQEALCPLEEDFDASWPDPRSYLPPRGREPTERSDDAYEPNPDRITVFEGYAFVFCDSGRFEDLQGPITNGHGKALLREIEHGTTTAEEIVDFMRKAAGSKGLGKHDSDGGVILVRCQTSGEHEDWTLQLESQIAAATYQEVIGPGEFLDAILRNNASCLLRPPPIQEHQEAPQSQADHGHHAEAGNENVKSAAGAGESQNPSRSSKRRTKVNFVSKFKSFDDGFDMDSIPTYTLQDGDVEGEPSQGAIPGSLADESALNDAIEAEDDLVSELLPGAAAMKQRLGDDGRKRRSASVQAVEPPPKPKKPKLNLIEAARQRREAQDEAAMELQHEEAESLQALADSLGVERLQNLAIVEEMALPIRSNQESRSHSGGDGWDERWNGRKNFKKFRRKGDGSRPQYRVQTVIVPLEEAKRRDFGIGDSYWTSSRRSRSQSHRPDTAAAEAPSLPAEVPESSQPSQRAPETQLATQPSQRNSKRRRDSDSDDGLRFRFRRKR
ncbi:hypothetical protein AJ80_08881 [Polytolypa hystricis UAMH7299]|uniref:FHA domain-containing protein n=1 Tax=Polytolypa hystricis (strain UAMH7299) TaxID=1447883 RepID=A0A2B7WZL4_POLH7|nr:hypothetical protein AJ80_08881 [Polytolypa hystricis UAMH7299]